MFINFSAIFIACFYYTHISAQLKFLNLQEGQSCLHPSGLNGTCRHLSKCLEVSPVIRKMKETNICSFQRGLYPIVCCLEKPKSLIVCEEYYRNLPILISNSIYNGNNATDGEFPHMAALGYITDTMQGIAYKCAGTLISDRYVLTAAHCMGKSMGILSKVRLGGLSLTSRNEGAEEFAVEKLSVHPKYRKGYNDIALIRLSETVKFKKTIMPACLLNAHDIPVKNLTVTGWGATDSSETKYPDILKKTILELVDLDQCNKTYFNSKYLRYGVTENMFCVRHPQGKSDTCGCDSGGPAQIRTKRFDKIYTVAGVLSIGPYPCGGAAPAVYSRVSRYLSWIESIVWR